MARLVTSGFEFQATLTLPSLGASESVDYRVAGPPSVETTTVRSGAASLKSQPGSATPRYGRWDAAIANGTAVFVRAYMRFDGTPTGDMRPITLTTSGGTNICHVRMSSGQTAIQLRDRANTAVGSASASLSANTWYRVELKAKLDASPSSSNGTLELWVDGVQVGTTLTNVDLATTAISQIRVGQSAATDQGVNFFFDDVAVNDDTGSDQTGLPGNGKVVLLKPVSDTTRDAGWLNGASGTTDLWDALDNRPPTGIAAPSGATTQIRHDTGAATPNYVATTESFTAAGIADVDTVKVVQAVDNFAGTVAASTAHTLKLDGNPSGSALANPGPPAVAVNTYPLGWMTHRTAPVYDPSVTKTSGVAVKVTRTDSSTDEVFVDLLGVYVDYRPATTVTATEATETDTAQALAYVKPINKAATAATEADAAQALVFVKPIHASVTVATETDTAQALTFRQAQAHSITAAAESDTAQALTFSKPLRVTIAPASEADAAQALTFAQAQSHSITPASETDEAQTLGITRPIYVSITPAYETDTAQDLQAPEEVGEGGWVRTRKLRLPGEEEPQVVLILPAYEQDTAVPLTYRKTPNPIKVEDDELLLIL